MSFESRLDHYITGGGEPDESDPIECTSCHEDFDPELDRCPHCGYINPIVEAEDADNEYDPTQED